MIQENTQATLAATQAATNAATAATQAASAATSIALLSNDSAWIKKSLSGIEQTLKELKGEFVSKPEFLELTKIAGDHETRIRTIEKSMYKAMGVVVVLNFLIGLATAYLLKFIN